MLLIFMIRSGEATKVATYFYLVPILTAAEAWLLFGEAYACGYGSNYNRPDFCHPGIDNRTRRCMLLYMATYNSGQSQIPDEYANSQLFRFSR